MKKYEVRIETTMHDYVIVEANDYREAENKAWAKLDSINLGKNMEAAEINMYCSEDNLITDDQGE